MKAKGQHMDAETEEQAVEVEVHVGTSDVDAIANIEQLPQEEYDEMTQDNRLTGGEEDREARDPAGLEFAITRPPSPADIPCGADTNVQGSGVCHGSHDPAALLFDVGVA